MTTIMTMMNNYNKCMEAKSQKISILYAYLRVGVHKQKPKQNTHAQQLTVD